mmetsp:Transcript_28772/g.35016  ORF Transcript_28772/g.35016 Transcript_28772/m.35016 type:complete len:168 (+) Transcript_28772:164-667(+)
MSTKLVKKLLQQTSSLEEKKLKRQREKNDEHKISSTKKNKKQRLLTRNNNTIDTGSIDPVTQRVEALLAFDREASRYSKDFEQARRSKIKQDKKASNRRKKLKELDDPGAVLSHTRASAIVKERRRAVSKIEVTVTKKMEEERNEEKYLRSIAKMLKKKKGVTDDKI